MQKRLPLGISDFKKIIDGKYAYVDKTFLISELVEQSADVALIPRMRRFGKTLNLSMLQYFFEKNEQDTSYLFKGLKIWESEKCRVLQGQFPVIFLSLKDVKYVSWEETFKALMGVIAEEFKRHRYVFESDCLIVEEKEIYQKIISEEGDLVLVDRSLRLLTEWLHRYHGKRVILLIDEYDTPAHAAYLNGYYDTVISFLRNWLSGGLKDNSFLERGVLTGILRIAKETMFSGLNNVITFSIFSEHFQDKFGLVESEVKALLEEYGLADKHSEIKEWYNGYQIGACEGIYNPWSVLSCIANKGSLAPYWVNTSDNSLMKQLITQGAEDLKIDIEELLKGGVIEKQVEEGTVFSDLEKSPNAVWSLLLFSGYVTIASTATYGKPCRLRIPNTEISELYKSTVANWFEKTIHQNKYRLLLSSLTAGDIDTFAQIFQEFFVSSASVFDVTAELPEKIYHAFVLGMLLGLKDTYQVKSNRESGYGRYDVMLIPNNRHELGIIMEFKKIGRFEQSDLESAIVSAFKQIEQKRYAQELFDCGVQRILYVALAFEGKKVAIRSKSHTSLEY